MMRIILTVIAYRYVENHQDMKTKLASKGETGLFLRRYAVGILAGFALCLILGACEYYGLFITRYSILIFALIFWFCVAALVSLLLLIFARHSRSAEIRWLSIGLGMLSSLAVVAPPIVEFAHGLALEYEIRHADSVIAGLESFYSKYERPANGFEVLVPEYLAGIPKPAHEACRYQYDTSATGRGPSPGENSGGNEQLSSDRETWAFSIECPADWLFDQEILVYRPDGEYEVAEFAWKQHAVGDWMYYYFRD